LLLDIYQFFIQRSIHRVSSCLVRCKFNFLSTLFTIKLIQTIFKLVIYFVFCRPRKWTSWFFSPLLLRWWCCLACHPWHQHVIGKIAIPVTGMTLIAISMATTSVVWTIFQWENAHRGALLMVIVPISLKEKEITFAALKIIAADFSKLIIQDTGVGLYLVAAIKALVTKRNSGCCMNKKMLIDLLLISRKYISLLLWTFWHLSNILFSCILPTS